jgi:hypothetical protein
VVNANEVSELENQRFQELMGAIDMVPADRREERGVVPDWSTHDVLWHVAYWVGRAADVLDQARQGPPFPEEPEEDSYYDEQNAAAVAPGRAMSWEQVVEHFERSRERLRSALESCDEATCEWITERSMEEVEHYHVHTAQVRDFAEKSLSP